MTNYDGKWEDSIQLRQNDIFQFERCLQSVKISAEWLNLPGIICDLDIVVYYYDDRARLIERLDFTKTRNADKSIILAVDGTDQSKASSSHSESVTVDYAKVHDEVSCILVCLDGDARNFQYVHTVNMRCMQPPTNNIADSFVNNSSTESNSYIFQSSHKTKKDCKGLILCTLYRDKWIEGLSTWAMKLNFQTLSVATTREKEEVFHSSIIHSVPSLERFKPYIFSNVRAICAALSSQSLPKLKLKFQREEGLKPAQFLDLIFKQLAETHPQILELREAEYTVGNMRTCSIEHL